MKAAAQVLHLFRFDLLRLRWWLAAYGVTLWLAVLAALHIAPAQGELADLAPYLLVVVGMLVAVTVIQADSPVRPEAFWRGHAVHAAVLLTAKTALIFLLLVVLPVLITGAVVSSLHVPLRDVVLMFAVAAPQLALWTMLAVLTAASTRDTKSAVLLFIGSMIVSTLLAEALPRSFNVASILRRISWAWVFVTSGAFLAIVYLRGLSSRAATVACLVLVTTGVIVATQGSHRRTEPGRDIPIEATESLEIDDLNLKGSARADGAPTLRVRVVGAHPNVRYDVGSVALTAFFTNGDSIHVALNGTLGTGDLRDLIALPTGMRWRPARHRANSREGTLVVPINWQEERQAIVRRLSTSERRIDTTFTTERGAPVAGTRIRDDAVVRVRVHATLARYAADELVAGPFSTDAELTARGQRLLLHERVDSAGRNKMSAEWLAVGDASRYRTIDGNPHYSHPFVFVLQHAARGEAVTLNVRTRVGEENSFVLPGVDRRLYRFDFDGAAAIDSTLDAEWLRGATFRMLRWRPLASVVHLTAERTVP